MQTYKLTKAIRFKLEAEDEEINEINKEVEGLEQPFDLANFISQLKNFIVKLEEYLFDEKDEKNKFLKSRMIIKREWLRTYAKQQWANYQEMQKAAKKNYSPSQAITYHRGIKWAKRNYYSIF